MYKFLLGWRYLRTRYIALVSIISVMLGVATMIVVNAVMEGFTHEMQDRIHGILSDIVFESRSLEGVPNADRHMQEIRRVAGDYIEGMSPTVQVPAMLGFTVGGQYFTKQILLIGIEEETYASVSDFGRYLQHPANREQLDFKLREGGYDSAEHRDLKYSGWPLRRQKARFGRATVAPTNSLEKNPITNQTATAAADSNASDVKDPFAAAQPVGEDFDPAREQHPGAILGIAVCSYRSANGSESFFLLPGDDIEITYPSAGKPPKPLSAKFTTVDFYESKMNENDSSFAFVPIRTLQELRGMIEPVTEIANFNSIQIRLKPGTDLDAVRDLLRSHFPPQFYMISTWRDKQGALLSAVWLETAILNLLLFMIIAVAGFGILAIFFMIVVEKTRDIGVLKSLGATGWGIMGIFLGYGLSLGIVGAGVGTALGLLIVRHINELADFIGWLRGQSAFDPSIYYFTKIPTIIDWFTVACIVSGAMAIAVLASILPARRAARLRPVEALRYE